MTYNKLILSILALIFSIFIFTFASVPIYNIFCKVTGYGGITKQKNIISLIKDYKTNNKVLIIEFDSNVDNDLPWKFIPKQHKTTVIPGHITLIFYEAENLTNQDIIGTAVYNVTPNKAGKYFIKIHCFCFEEQLIKAKQKLLMPVTFLIDPKFENDPEMFDIHTITLSYSFFKT